MSLTSNPPFTKEKTQLREDLRAGHMLNELRAPALPTGDCSRLPLPPPRSGPHPSTLKAITKHPPHPFYFLPMSPFIQGEDSGCLSLRPPRIKPESQSVPGTPDTNSMQTGESHEVGCACSGGLWKCAFLLLVSACDICMLQDQVPDILAAH